MKLHKLILMAVMLLLIPVNVSAYKFKKDNICYNILDASAKTVEVTYYDVDGQGKTYNRDTNVPSTSATGQRVGGVSISVSLAGRHYNGDIVIPSQVEYNGNTYDVVAIGDYAFSQCHQLTSVFVPKSIVSIGKSALSASAGSNNVDDINSYSNLSSVIFEKGSELKSVAANAFAKDKKLTSISLPQGLETIGSSAFYDCDGLKEILIPEGVTTIASWAFRSCDALTSVGLPSTLISMDSAFDECKKLTTVTCRATTPPTIKPSTFPQYGTLYVPYESISAYQTVDYWKKFSSFKPCSFTLEDAEVFSNADVCHNQDITYTRNFKNTNWQALYIPFSMSYDDWKDNFDVARINNFFYRDNDDDGVNEEAFLNVTKVKSGTLKANYPYLIRAKATGEYTFSVTNATLYKAESKTVTCSSVDYNYTFVGIYETYSDLYANKEHAMSGGELKQAASESATLSPYRWYLKSEAREPSVIESKIRNIRIHVEGEEETSIATLDYGNKPVEKVYNLNGQFVGTSLDSLAPGVYIKGGKKYVVK